MVSRAVGVMRDSEMLVRRAEVRFNMEWEKGTVRASELEKSWTILEDAKRTKGKDIMIGSVIQRPQRWLSNPAHVERE